ncbi:Homoserine O-acetyltransferase [Bacillus sp. THAF10]|nr:Homoserine O-acetyltransferase [Bacillus sp. THAF10]
MSIKDIQKEIRTVSIGKFKTESGEELSDVVIAYEKVGTPTLGTILVCHALTGNHVSVGNQDNPGWWGDFIGSGLYVDTDKFQVITMNVIGGCNGTTGPTSINPATRKPYGSDFPVITIRDMVHAQYQGLITLGVKNVKAIIGGSLGGMQVLEWGILYPDFAEIIVPIAVTPYFTDYALAYNVIGRQAIINDPEFDNGHYQEGAVIKGLEIARMVGLVTYRSDTLFNERFKREKKQEHEFQVDSYLKYQGQKFSRRFDANSYLRLLNAMDKFDIGDNRKGWKNALKEISATVCFISFKGDLLYPGSLVSKAVAYLQSINKDSTHLEVETMFGHDGFLVEFEKWGDTIKNLIEKDNT